MAHHYAPPVRIETLNKKNLARRAAAAIGALSMFGLLSGCSGSAADGETALEGEYYGYYNPDKFTSEESTLKFDGEKMEYFVQTCEGYRASSLSKGVLTDDKEYVMWTDKGQFKGLNPISRDAAGEVVYMQGQMFFKSGTDKANDVLDLHKMGCS